MGQNPSKRYQDSGYYPPLPYQTRHMLPPQATFPTHFQPPFMPSYPQPAPQYYPNPFPSYPVMVGREPSRHRRRKSRRHSSRRYRRDSSTPPPSRPPTGMDYRSSDHAPSSNRHNSMPVIPSMSHSRNHSSHPDTHLTRSSNIGITYNDNPLPTPPRDIYELTPHRDVLSLPETAAIFTGMLNDRLVEQSKPRGLKGLFRSKHKKDKTRYVPVAFTANGETAATGYGQLMQAAGPHDANQSNVGHASFQRAGSSHGGHVTMPEATPMPQPAVIPPPGNFTPGPPPSTMPSNEPVIVGPSRLETMGLGLTSQHRVEFDHHIFPTAYHLYEALKFYPHDLPKFEDIRRIVEPANIAAYVYDNQDYQLPNWADVFERKLDETLYLKFSQHPNLLHQLLETGERTIIHEDTQPRSFWGVDASGQGENHMGQALMRVRDRFKNESR